VKQPSKNRFSVGRRVLVGQRNRIGTVKSIADSPDPRCMGEFRHEVLVDGETDLLGVMGCDLEGVPEVDHDLQESRPAVHLTLQNSSVANLNLGTQVGTITVALESISQQHGGVDLEFADAIKQLTEAVLSQATMADDDKREVVQVLSTIAEEGAKEPKERSMGRLKAAVGWLPTAIATASSLTTLWNKFEPTIRAHFHL
jgi:hypothetical protein